MNFNEVHVEQVKLLREVFKRNGTDKVSHRYAIPYARFFANVKELPIKFMEIGVKEGKSLTAWQEYFPNASIIGIDIDTACNKFQNDRTKICIGDQSDSQFLTKVSEENGPFDVIIDDGSHEAFDQQVSLECLWDNLNPGGIYVIEDLNCCRLACFNKKPCEIHTNDLVLKWAKDLMTQRRHKNTKEIYVYCNMVIFVKPYDWKW